MTALKLTPADIEDILRRMETGDTTIADANAVRAHILSLRAAVDDDAVIGDDPVRFDYGYPDGVTRIEVNPHD